MIDGMHERQIKLQKELEELNPGSNIKVTIGRVPRWRYWIGQTIDGACWGMGATVGVVSALRFYGWLYG